jgi:hypothetical protein
MATVEVPRPLSPGDRPSQLPRVDRAGAPLGAFAGLVGITCCLGPTVLAVLGLTSVSFAISLGNTLYYTYGWYFRGAAILLATLGTLHLLNRRAACSLQGARQQWRLLATVLLAMMVVYVVFLALTAYLERVASP